MPKFKDISSFRGRPNYTKWIGCRMEEFVLIVVAAVSLLQVTGTCEGFNLQVDSQRIECQNLRTYCIFISR
jgi:hypothetical protein